MTKQKHILWLLGLLLLFTACTSEDTTPPSLAITSPAAGSPVSGTVTVQVSAKDDIGLSSVELYARGKDSEAKGVLAGSAVEEPFVISWNTGNVPNGADLELVAIGKDSGGNESASPPSPSNPKTAASPSCNSSPPSPSSPTPPRARRA